MPRTVRQRLGQGCLTFDRGDHPLDDVEEASTLGSSGSHPQRADLQSIRHSDVLIEGGWTRGAPRNGLSRTGFRDLDTPTRLTPCRALDHRKSVDPDAAPGSSDREERAAVKTTHHGNDTYADAGDHIVVTRVGADARYGSPA